MHFLNNFFKALDENTLRSFIQGNFFSGLSTILIFLYDMVSGYSLYKDAHLSDEYRVFVASVSYRLLFRLVFLLLLLNYGLQYAEVSNDSFQYFRLIVVPVVAYNTYLRLKELLKLLFILRSLRDLFCWVIDVFINLFIFVLFGSRHLPSFFSFLYLPFTFFSTLLSFLESFKDSFLGFDCLNDFMLLPAVDGGGAPFSLGKDFLVLLMLNGEEVQQEATSRPPGVQDASQTEMRERFGDAVAKGSKVVEQIASDSGTQRQVAAAVVAASTTLLLDVATGAGATARTAIAVGALALGEIGASSTAALAEVARDVGEHSVVTEDDLLRQAQTMDAENAKSDATSRSLGVAMGSATDATTRDVEQNLNI
jgi:hypothetical protein